MLRIAIVDDDMLLIAEMTWYLQQFYEDTLFEQDDFSDGAEFIKSLKNNDIYDIVFMDIEMPGIKGDEAVRELRKYDIDEKTFVVYVSSHTDNLSGLFSLHPFDFIVKPVSREGIFNTLRKITKARQDKSLTVTVLVNRKEIGINLNEILYVESRGHKLLIYIKGQLEPYSSYMKIEEFYSKVREKSADFIRTHASFVVNRCYVKRYFKDYVIVGEKEIPVSSKYKNRMLVDVVSGV